MRDANITPPEEGEGNEYDATKRDPLYSHAETTPLWEIAALQTHYHPSVRSFANGLRDEETNNKIIYTGDPLLDFSTSSFLERFSYRNPKQKDLSSISRESGRGGGLSVMAPIAPGKYGRISVANPVNSKDFIEQKSQSVRPEEKFFYNFFKSKDLRDRRVDGSEGRRKAALRKGEEEEEEEEEGEEEDDMQEIADVGSDYGSDPEEEAYAQELAENLMKEHAASNHAPDEDEEPEFDWSAEEDADGDEEPMFQDDDDDDDGEEEGDEEEMDMAFDDEDDSELEDDSEFEEEEEVEEKNQNGRKRKGGGGNGNKKTNTFAEADEFADILDASGKSHVNKHQAAWEKRNDWRKSNGQGAKRQRRR